jgi:hypothetical protein
MTFKMEFPLFFTTYLVSVNNMLINDLLSSLSSMYTSILTQSFILQMEYKLGVNQD